MLNLGRCRTVYDLSDLTNISARPAARRIAKHPGRWTKGEGVSILCNCFWKIGVQPYEQKLTVFACTPQNMLYYHQDMTKMSVTLLE